MLNALVALVPLSLALILLTIFRQNSRVVGLVTLGSALILVIAFPPFRLSPFRIILSLGTGAAASLTLLTILLPAIILYQFQRAGGAMAVLIEGIWRITPDRDLLVLLLVFGVAPFLDAICGVNVGIIVIAPILLNLSLPPLRVACLCMVSMVTSVWGTMGVVILLVSSSTGISSAVVGSYSAILLMPATLCLCAAALWITGKEMRAILHMWLPVIGTAAILTVGAWIVTRLAGVELVGMVTDSIVIVFLVLLGHVQARRPNAQGRLARREGMVSLSQWQIWKAALPYTALTVFLFVSRIIPPFENWLQSHMVLSIPAIGLAFPTLYLPGLWLLVTACLAALLLRLNGPQVSLCVSIAFRQFAPSALAIVSFLAVAQVMQESGMIAAFGRVVAALGTQYVWISPWLGAVSGWATGSTISGNSLFSTLQKSIAIRTGLSTPWIVAAQNTASSLGKILSPTSVILSGSASGITGQEGLILRIMGVPTLLSLLLLTAALGAATGYFIGAVSIVIFVLTLFLFFVFRRQVPVAPVQVALAQHGDHERSDVERSGRPRVGQQSQELMALLARAPEGMSRVKISAALKQPAPAVYRLLQTLQAQGYVRRSGNTYVSGLSVTDDEAQDVITTPADAVSPSLDTRSDEIRGGQWQGEMMSWDSLLPHIEGLTDRLQEVSYLAALADGQVVCVAVARPARFLRCDVEVDRSLPLLNTACGRVLLAYQEEHVRSALARSVKQIRGLDAIDLDQIALEAKLVQHRGYATDDEELDGGVASFAVPVQDQRGVLIAALAISGPSSRLRLQRRAAIIDEIKRTSVDMTTTLRSVNVA